MFEIGNSLREARLRQNIELTEAELATKIRGKYLRALEEEQFELLPAQTYVKGFLRTYAEWLGLDGQLYVDEYNSRYVTGEDEVPYRPRRSGTTSAHARSDSKAVVYALAGIGVLTALVIVAWRFGGSGDRPTVPNVPHQATTARRAPAPSIVLRAVRGDSHVTVRAGSARGKQVFQGTIERGRAEHFTSRRLWVSARPPANIRVTINAKPVRTPRGGTAQELIVTAKGVSLAPSA
ncbi:MAG: helix-turn-helix domain-containing protein [Actinomycetota bacterium]|nr:helix-turn-helix domain-containing protein [Actinomycetota bacterium]